jgi:hypothetical protein
MGIYVDNLKPFPDRPYGHFRWCHMMTDETELDELHDMARKLGLYATWFQRDPLHPHYDLTATKRRQAIRLGAIPVSAVEIVKRCSFKRGWEVE